MVQSKRPPRSDADADTGVITDNSGLQQKNVSVKVNKSEKINSK